MAMVVVVVGEGIIKFGWTIVAVTQAKKSRMDWDTCNHWRIKTPQELTIIAWEAGTARETSG